MSSVLPASCILHGGDYNPEQWPRQVWDDDVRLMNKANVNVATLPVFGWVSLQPAENVFTFEWLDDIIEKLTQGGVKFVLATATASTPAWLDETYPDVLRVDRQARKLGHGGRHSFCPHSPNFRRLSAQLAGMLAERYGKHPGLVAWHIGNEYGNICYCDTCGEAFREWLRKKYGTLDELNERWYTKFWGHTYTSWSQVMPPRDGQQQAMQAILTDYDRFASESLLNCYVNEKQAIRKHSPNIPITTNMMSFYKPLDYQMWAKEVDIISWDSYPQAGASASDIAFGHSVMRGAKEGQSWMLMEQTPSQQNWQWYNSLKRPGIMRLWSLQAVAHGADAVMYFQWRRSRGGCEKMHGAVVAHSGREDTRVFKEVSELGKDLVRLGDKTLGGEVQTEAALIFDWNNWWALEYSAGPSIDLKYVDQCNTYFGAAHDAGLTLNLIGVDADFSRYKLLVMPTMFMVKPGLAEKLEKFVAGGGTVVGTYITGIVDATDRAYLGGYPGPLKNLFGVWAEETDVMTPKNSNKIDFKEPFGALTGALECRHLADRIHIESPNGKALAFYVEDFYAGEPALTVNKFGKGSAYYIATQLGREDLTKLYNKWIADLGLNLPLAATPPKGVEATVRSLKDGSNRLLYVLNHNAEPAEVTLPGTSYTDLLTGQSFGKQVTLGKYAVLILEEK